MNDENILDASMIDTATGHPGGKMFRYSSEGRAALRKQVVTQRRVTIALTMVFGVGIGLYQMASNVGISTLEAMMVPVAAVIIALVLMGRRNGSKKLDEIMDSFKLIVTPDYLIREQKGLLPITFRKSEITQIVKTKSYYLVVAGSKTNAITIPIGLNDPEQLEAMLSNLCALTPGKDKTPRNKIIGYVVMGLFLVSFVVLRFSENQLAEIAAMMVLLALIIILLVYFMRSKTIDKSTRQYRTLIIIMVVAMVLMIYSIFSMLYQ